MRATASARPASVTPFSKTTTGGAELARSDNGAHVPSSLSVAIMQPYFIPYAGYFRLFAASDLFVIYDCVQFPRRGWVHRNRLLDAAGRECWLTLPLAKAPRDVRIRDLRFSADADRILEDRMRRIPLLAAPRQPEPEIVASLKNLAGTPVDYLERLLRAIVTYLGLRWQIVRSSTLDVPDSVRGQDRIIEIARRLGAVRYVNAPGRARALRARAVRRGRNRAAVSRRLSRSLVVDPPAHPRGGSTVAVGRHSRVLRNLPMIDCSTDRGTQQVYVHSAIAFR